MKRVWLMLLGLVLLAGAAGGIAWGVRQMIQALPEKAERQIPVAAVRRGDVTITVTAKGELQGGNSEMIIVPPVGNGDVPIISLRSTGEIVEPGDVVAELDKTLQEYNLREAEADLAEADQHVIQAEADAAASVEEARYAVLSATSDVEIAQIETRKNELLAANVARQNDIGLAAAQNKKDQADRDLKNRQASVKSSVDVQRANQNKFKMLAQSAQQTMDSMVLKSKSKGYVHVLPNSGGQLQYSGMILPDFRVGDIARPGQILAQIPDMSTWEISTSIPELDRGYLQVGQPAEVRPSALGGKTLKGHVKMMGGTTGYGANRRFDSRILLDEVNPILRPGMTTTVVITVATLKNVLWAPSQAVFENDGKAYVFIQGAQGFVQQDVKLVRRGESQSVIEGLKEGTKLALSRPDKNAASGDEGNNALKALTK
jgi:multidrug efflux pump subunit AcrA (membrane-fusion protein)